MNQYEKILWIDGGAAIVVGTFVLLVHELLSSLYGLPTYIVLILASGNLLYSIYSLTLALKPSRRLLAIKTLVLGNLIWATFCLSVVYVHYATATQIGLFFISFEAVFVIVLAILEWRWRYLLTTAVTD